MVKSTCRVSASGMVLHRCRRVLRIAVCSQRLRYLELKTNAFMNWGNFYDLDMQMEHNICKTTFLVEFDPHCNKAVFTDARKTPFQAPDWNYPQISKADMDKAAILSAADICFTR